jgi:DNA-binding transcriptional regulator GbsR (MarR family)
MTKIEMFKALKEIADVKANADYTAFIDNEIALLEKRKANKSNSLTKNQKANLGIMDTIVATLGTLEKPVTVTELVKAIGDETLTNQKVSALLKKLVETNKVTKEYEKKVARFALAPAETE